MDPNSRRDAENDSVVKEFLADKEAIQMTRQTKRLSDIDASQIKMAVLIGGHGALFDFPKEQTMSKLLSRVYYENRGIIAAISQGVVGLLAVKDERGTPLVKDKKITCSSDEEEQRFRNQSALCSC